MEKFINLLNKEIAQLKKKDLHINDNESISNMRSKDMDFGKLVAYEKVLSWIKEEI